MACNIGLLGAASIAPRSVISPARKLGNAAIYGVAATDVNKAIRFARLHGITHIFTDYRKMLECNDIHAVYIAQPNHLHAHWCIEAARAKKHIMVEKPLCLNNSEALRIKEAAENNGVEILEGVMTQHHPWESKLADIVRQEHLGKLIHVKTQQTFRLEKSDNYRFSRKYGGGVFIDEACYWLRLLQVLDLLPLEHIRGDACFYPGSDVDTTSTIHAQSKNGTEVEALFSYDMPYEATHYLTFTDGTIRIRNFLAPSLGDFRIRIEMNNVNGNGVDVITFDPVNYFLNQLDFFIKVIDGEKENVPLDQSVERIAMMDKIRTSVMEPHYVLAHVTTGVNTSSG